MVLPVAGRPPVGTHVVQHMPIKPTGGLPATGGTTSIHGHDPKHYTENIRKIWKIKSICMENTEKYETQGKYGKSILLVCFSVLVFPEKYGKCGKSRRPLRKNTENTEKHGKIRKFRNSFYFP